METQKYIPLLLLFILLVAPKETWAQENENEPSATWIWYPGDYEIWLSNKMQARRTERGAFLPPLWRYYSPYALVTFRKEFTLPAEDEIAIYTEGQFKLQIDGKQQHGSSRKITDRKSVV